MKKKIYLGIAIAIILLFANNTVFAKYIYEHIIGGEIYIDRTFPIISVTIDKNTKNYHLTQNETIKTSKDFSISVNDNGEISYKKYFYNPSQENFDLANGEEIENNSIFSKEGFYKFVVIDSYGNSTKIKILLDKTPPEINVTYSKEEQVSFTKIGAEIKNFGALNGSVSVITNENDFRNAFYDSNVSEIILNNDIDLTSRYVSNRTIRITSNSNRIRLASQCDIVINGSSLIINNTKIDGKYFGEYDYKNCITVKTGGTLVLTGFAGIEGGKTNTGIYMETYSNLFVESCQISDCDIGIKMTGNSFCDLGSSFAEGFYGYTGNNVLINYNGIGIFCDSSYIGSLTVNHLSQDNEKINFEHNSWGIAGESNNGKIEIKHARMVFNIWAIYTKNQVNINQMNGAFNKKGIVNEGGNVNFNDGAFYASDSSMQEHGIYNLYGTININNTAEVSNANYGIWNNGTINMTNGIVKDSIIGVENYGTFKMINGNIKNNFEYGISNKPSESVFGFVSIVDGTINDNGIYDIYHEKSDSDPSVGAYYGGLIIEKNRTIESKIYLAKIDNYIYTSDYEVKFNSITVSEKYNDRIIIRTNSKSLANKIKENVNVTNKEKYFCKVRDKYIILSLENNTATVEYEDKLSGIKSAVYWFNPISDEFLGDGIAFSNLTVFDVYGHYRVVVEDNVGLKKEVKFEVK